MKLISFAACLLAGSMVLGRVAACFGDAPATLPSASGTPAAPAGVQQAMAAAPFKILVLPFVPINPSDTHDWIGHALERCVVTELSRGEMVRPIASDPIVPVAGLDGASVLAAARSAGAAFVIFGNYQVEEPNVRVFGQVVNVQTGAPVGALGATGMLDDLFSIEDVLASQVRRRLTAAIPAETSPAPLADARPVAPLDPLRVAPPIRTIAPMPSTELPDPTALLDGPSDYSFGYGCGNYGGCGYGGNSGYGWCGFGSSRFGGRFGSRGRSGSGGHSGAGGSGGHGR